MLLNLLSQIPSEQLLASVIVMPFIRRIAALKSDRRLGECHHLHQERAITVLQHKGLITIIKGDSKNQRLKREQLELVDLKTTFFERVAMRSIIYLIGLAVVIYVILRVLGLA